MPSLSTSSSVDSAPSPSTEGILCCDCFPVLRTDVTWQSSSQRPSGGEAQIPLLSPFQKRQKRTLSSQRVSCGKAVTLRLPRMSVLRQWIGLEVRRTFLRRGAIGRVWTSQFVNCWLGGLLAHGQLCFFISAPCPNSDLLASVFRSKKRRRPNHEEVCTKYPPMLHPQIAFLRYQ